MPVYQYVCRSCGRDFDRLVMGQTQAACPACGGDNLERRFSVFAVHAGGARQPAPQPTGACGSCGDPRGPGACSLN
jgi:putative FmdB family regulatory protein